MEGYIVMLRPCINGRKKPGHIAYIFNNIIGKRAELVLGRLRLRARIEILNLHSTGKDTFAAQFLRSGNGDDFIRKIKYINK